MNSLSMKTLLAWSHRHFPANSLYFYMLRKPLSMNPLSVNTRLAWTKNALPTAQNTSFSMNFTNQDFEVLFYITNSYINTAQLPVKGDGILSAMGNKERITISGCGCLVLSTVFIKTIGHKRTDPLIYWFFRIAQQTYLAVGTLW